MRSCLPLVLALGCTGAPPPEVEIAREPAPPLADATAPDAATVADDAAPPRRRYVAAVTDPRALAPVAAAGGRFADLVPPPAWAAIAATLRADVAAIGRGDPRAGVGIRHHAHRLFDTTWLEPKNLELIAVVNRLDRLARTPGACGDTRLVYRLRSRGERLPMTAVVILPGAPAAGGCGVAASRWMAPAAIEGEALGAWLVGQGGPLGDALAPGRVTKLLTNLQAVRWPSKVHPDLGGHAEYLFRSHGRSAGGSFEPAALEAVPDVERIRGDAALRRRLLSWLRDPATIEAADRGAAVLPAELRATLSRAVTPRGFSRIANRPFRQLVAPGDLAGLELAKRQRVKTPEALLLRLDEQTCAGCHSARSVAGFHLLGTDGAGVVGGNALLVPYSPYMASEIERRRRLGRALAAGEAASAAPPFASRGPGEAGGSGARCGLGEDFAAWGCAAGLECSPFDAPKGGALGVCLAAASSAVGEPCEIGPLVGRADPRLDRIPKMTPRPCAAGLACIPSRQGFPGGMCAAYGCGAIPDRGVCGLIAGHGFDRCLVAGRPFARCIEETAMKMTLRACDRSHPCRDDYVCARAPGDGDRGACVPPYFMFQLRVDGHPGQ